MQHWEDNCIESPWLFRRVLSGAAIGISTGILEAKFPLLCYLALFFIPPQALDSFNQFNKENRDVKDGKPLNILWKWEAVWMKEETSVLWLSCSESSAAPWSGGLFASSKQGTVVLPPAHGVKDMWGSCGSLLWRWVEGCYKFWKAHRWFWIERKFGIVASVDSM